MKKDFENLNGNKIKLNQKDSEAKNIKKEIEKNAQII